MMIDILYIKGKKSPNNDLELMYSLRSLEYNCMDYGRVFITGECPEYVDENKVVFTPADDVGVPMMNHWWKVQQTIDRTDISDDFVLMYDDIFFTKTVYLTDYPFYKRGVLGMLMTGGEVYRQNLLNTKIWLENHHYPIYDFELHVPCIYNREKFSSLRNIFDPLKDRGQPISCRSIYANLFCPESPYRIDIKLREKGQIVPTDFDCFSVSDNAFKYETLEYLENKYSERSDFEKWL